MTLSLVCETASHYGVEQLEDASLLCTMLNGRGNTQERAQKLLDACGGLKYLPLMGQDDLEKMGFSTLEAIRILSIGELNRRCNRANEPVKINSPKAAGAYLLPKARFWTEERFGLLALNAKGDLLAERTLAQGIPTAVLISPREFFREALRYGATSAVAWHNHPSGDCEPSKEDKLITKRLRASGESLGVPLSDHIILGGERYYSFRAAEGWDQQG
jgi:DNA repair protein RadC